MCSQFDPVLTISFTFYLLTITFSNAILHIFIFNFHECITITMFFFSLRRMEREKVSILWFRNGLRLHDNGRYTNTISTIINTIGINTIGTNNISTSINIAAMIF